MIDGLGDRMKMYEAIESERTLIPGLPVCVRLDGRAFHTFTKGLERPFDERLSKMMIETTKTLVEETHANIGYTQSDEISLIFIPKENTPMNMFNGRIQKIVSTLAGIASARFGELKSTYLPEKKKRGVFDCRVWNVPSIDEAINSVRWREWDATKNSISMAASAYYSHTELNKMNGSEKQDMLMKKGVNFNDFPAFFKRGTYVQRKTFTKEMSELDILNLPEKHTARTNGSKIVKRSSVVVLDLPPINKITNFKDVLLHGVDAKTLSPGETITQPIKIGLDIHGVIDTLPFLAVLSEVLVTNGHEVHIITGAPWSAVSDGTYTHEGISDYLINHGFIKDKNFTHFFSIVDYHNSIGTQVTCDVNGCWLENDIWNKTKAEYCERMGINLHLDDSMTYAKLFTTPVAVII